jgi:hypothetical protein
VAHLDGDYLGAAVLLEPVFQRHGANAGHVGELDGVDAANVSLLAGLGHDTLDGREHAVDRFG